MSTDPTTERTSEPALDGAPRAPLPAGARATTRH